MRAMEKRSVRTNASHRAVCGIDRSAIIGTTALVLAALLPAGVSAEPVVDRALSDIQVIEEKGCSRIRIGFNFRVRYSGHVPTGEGRSLTVQVRAVDRLAASSMIQLKREALRPLKARVGNVQSIEFDVAGGVNPNLRLEFDRPLLLDAAQGGDFTSIIIALGDRSTKKPCSPVFPATSGWDTNVVAAPHAPGAAANTAGESIVPRASGQASPAAIGKVASAMDESRAAIKKAQYDVAIRKLRSVLKAPENSYSRQAQELLGTAYQRKGDNASARAQYEDYLARYPDDDDSHRVRQRLRGILTALGEAPPKLREAKGSSSGSENGESRWAASGSFSQFYLRNDSFRTIRDPSLPPEVNPDPDSHRVHQNSLLTGLDLAASWSNANSKSKFRFSATEEHDFSGRDPEIVGVASLFLETSLRDYDLNIKAGRQTQNANGVLGRFDGAEVVWRASDLVRLGVVGGSPVWRRSDAPFEDEKYFYGAHVGFTPLAGLDISVYALEQRVDALIDRRAIGTDFRYLTPTLSAFATLDYDIHFNEVNLALANVSWTLPDKTVIYGAIDHRKSPLLTSWAALQGQPFLTLYDMLKQHSEDDIYRFAVDRAATYNSASIGVSHPWNEHWQTTLDVNWTNVSDTPESGGVPGQLGTGDEFYYSAQLIGTNLTTEGDMLIAALRLADRQLTDLYVIDAQIRYPVTEALRVSPRLRLGYLTGSGLDLTEYTVQPSLLVDYALTKDLHFEAEVGANWNSRHSGDMVENDTELFITAGYRYDFYADGKSPCRLPALACHQATR